MTLKDVEKQVSESTGVPVKVVREVYDLYWRFFRETIEALPLYDNDSITEEEYNKLRTSFSIRHIGKFGICYPQYKKTWNKIKYLKERFKDVQY